MARSEYPGLDWILSLNQRLRRDPEEVLDGSTGEGIVSGFMTRDVAGRTQARNHLVHKVFTTAVNSAELASGRAVLHGVSAVDV